MNFYKVWFAILPVSNNAKLKLLEKYENEETIYKVLNSDSQDYTRFFRKELKKKISREDVDKFVDYLIAKKIELTTYTDELYPNLLKNIEDAPYCLFYKGNIDILNKKVNIAVVGSRKCTTYGREVTRSICKTLSNYDVCIISGVAYGIDAEAHKSVMESNGATCGVLGCGIDVIYPVYNKAIYEDIVANGCLISEFPPGTKPLAHNFPRRNRIISGLTTSVIVIEANERSGSLITASYALAQGREVLAVPGSIFSPQSKGTNRLIKDGATPILSTDTLLFDLKISSTEIKKVNNALKWQIIKLLNDKPTHIDEIIRNTDIDTSTIYELLFEMQFNNEIMCILGNYYIKNI